MPSPPEVLILYNKPHKRQMQVLATWLRQHAPHRRYQLVTQWRLNRALRKASLGKPKKAPRTTPRGTPPRAVITYNKSLFRAKTVQRLVRYCKAGGTVVALHHNVSSMMLRRPAWLAFTGVHVTRDPAAAHRWGVIEGGDLFLLNLAPEHPVTTRDVPYEAEAPRVDALEGLAGVLPEPSFHVDPGREIFTYEIPPDRQAAAADLPRAPAIVLPKSEYFINHELRPDPARTLLFAVYFTDAASGRQLFSANGGWVVPRGKGLLYYFMPGHSPADYTAAYCQVIANCLDRT